MKFPWIVSLILLLGILSGCVGLTPKPIFTPHTENTPSRAKSPPQQAKTTLSQPQPEGRVTSLLSDRTEPAISLSLENQEKIMQQVEKYLGIPYRWGGMTESGMDCSGFVVVVFRDAIGVVLPHSTSKLYSLGETIAPQDLDFGDLVFFRDVGRQRLLHVGIFLGGARFAHASTSEGVTISSLRDDYYRTRFLGARRVLNLQKTHPKR